MEQMDSTAVPGQGEGDALDHPPAETIYKNDKNEKSVFSIFSGG